MQIDHNLPNNFYSTGKWHPIQIYGLKYSSIAAHMKKTIKGKYYNLYYQQINPLKVIDHKGKEHVIITLGDWFFGMPSVPKKYRLMNRRETWYIQISDYVPEELKSCILKEFQLEE